jgi:hypothetical protein
MIGMVLSKIGTTSKFRMIGSSIPIYNSINERKVGSLEVDPIEVAEIKFAYSKDPWISDSINVDTLS